jgi:hypothetical protein
MGINAKPDTVQDLVQNILKFWCKKVTIDYCNKKIDHLFKVIDAAIALNGKATGL